MKKNKLFNTNIIFLFATVFLIVLSLITYLRIESLIDSSKQVNHTSRVEFGLNNIFANLKDIEAGQRGYLLTNDSVFLDHYYKAIGNLTIYFKILDSLAEKNPSQQHNIKALKLTVYKRIEQLKKTMVDARTSNTYPIELLEGKALMNEVREQINKMETEESHLLKQSNRTFDEETLVTPFFTISLIGFFIFISLIAYFQLIKALKISVELESDLEKKNNSLQKNIQLLTIMNKELETFTFISSHDMQEPLRKIQTFINFLLGKEKANLSDEGNFYLQRIYATAKRMRTTIDDLLKYSHLKNTDQKTEITGLNGVIEEVVNDYSETIERKKAVIEVNCFCQIRVIPIQFRQLMDNLINNSLKYTKINATPQITIACEIKAGNKLNKELFLWEINYCHISVTDNGIGFEQKYKDRIFEVFQRLHNSDVYEGSGMGLAICKRIVENHKGIITATGKLDQGAKFDIYIPIS